MTLPYWFNSAWMWRCRKAWYGFHQASHSPEQVQLQILRRIVESNRDTQWGQQFGFANIRTPADYQARVPISDYASYEESIDLISHGQSEILTAEKVLLLEPTSGSLAGRKLIPYTASLRAEFQLMIGAWIYNLFSSRPHVRRGRAYWSISPVFGPPECTQSGIPIGFEDDSKYLSRSEQWLVNRLMAVPPQVRTAESVEEFRYLTLLHLLKCRDLSLVSVWSPTFLTGLLQLWEQQNQRLIADLSQSAPRRARQIDTIRKTQETTARQFCQIWPCLSMISCWADASAAPHAEELRQSFPHMEIQAKGLLATEGCVSFPLVDQPGAAIALTSHFLEFAEVDPSNQPTGNVLLAHQLESGGRYSILLTTGGGLYRYRLGDVIEVVGHYHRCPLVRFRGRIDAVSDLVGEKLSEPHVRAALKRVLLPLNIDISSALVVPVDGRPPRYRLLLAPPDAVRGRLINEAPNGSSLVKALAARLQTELESNPHYRYAIQLGQLTSIDVELLPSGDSPWRRYEERQISRGQKLGNVKPTSLAIGSLWPNSR